MNTLSNSKVSALLHAGESKNFFREPWTDYIKAYGFGPEDIDDLIVMATSQGLHNAKSDSSEVWAPVHAWRALGQLRAQQFIAPLLAALSFLHDDDAASLELPKVLGLIGESAIAPCAAYLLSKVQDDACHGVVSSALRSVAKTHPHTRSQILEVFRLYMSDPHAAEPDLNGFVVSDLIDLHAVELIDEIRTLFQQNLVAIGICGDLEEVEISFGLRSKRSTPRPNYHLQHIASGSYDPSMQELLAPWLEDDKNKPCVRTKKVGRNEPCPCESGRKFKKCCGQTIVV